MFFVFLSPGNGCSNGVPAPKNQSQQSCASCVQDLNEVLQADTEVLSHQISGHSLGQTGME